MRGGCPAKDAKEIPLFVWLAWLAGLDATGHYFATYRAESTSLPMS
jgi:hypothetical protein